MKEHYIIEAFQGLSGTYRLIVDPF